MDKRKAVRGKLTAAYRDLKQTITATESSIPQLASAGQVPNLIAAPTQADLLAAMDREPNLTDYGLGIFGAYRLTQAERLAEFERERARLATRLEMFRICCQWLALCQRRRTVNSSWTSYFLKHRVEQHFGQYITNGAFCLAVVHSGIPYRVHGPNIFIAISNKLPTRGTHGH